MFCYCRFTYMVQYNIFHQLDIMKKSCEQTIITKDHIRSMLKPGLYSSALAF